MGPSPQGTPVAIREGVAWGASYLPVVADSAAMQGKELVEHGLSWTKLGESLMGRKFPVWEFTASGKRISRGFASPTTGIGSRPVPSGDFAQKLITSPVWNWMFFCQVLKKCVPRKSP